jgi:hypothetical protein
MTVTWRPTSDPTMWSTDLITVGPESAVVDMLALTATFFSPEVVEATANLIVSNLSGSETLGMTATPLYFEEGDTIVVGFLEAGLQVIKQTGADLILVKDDDVPDRIYSTNGGSFICTLELLVNTLA